MEAGRARTNTRMKSGLAVWRRTSASIPVRRLGSSSVETETKTRRTQSKRKKPQMLFVPFVYIRDFVTRSCRKVARECHFVSFNSEQLVTAGKVFGLAPSAGRLEACESPTTRNRTGSTYG